MAEWSRFALGVGGHGCSRACAGAALDPQAPRSRPCPVVGNLKQVVLGKACPRGQVGQHRLLSGMEQQHLTRGDPAHLRRDREQEPAAAVHLAAVVLRGVLKCW